MKKNISRVKLFVSIILITSMFSTNLYSATELSFSDVKTTDWFYKDVISLVNKGVINGYTNGKFLPSKSVSVAEFIKMSLLANNQILIGESGSEWFSQYVETAIAHGYIGPDYYKDYQRPITRGEMGAIIAKMLNLSIDDSSGYISEIADYDTIKSDFKESSLAVYIAGIITGYTDGTIRVDNLANRSEAAVVIQRMIDPARRNPPVGAYSINEETSDPMPELIMAPLAIEQAAQVNISKCISVDGIQIGMAKDYVLLHLGQPDEILPNQYGYNWYVYSGDYSEFKILGIKDDKVVSFYSNVEIESSLGIKIGSSDSEAKLALDLYEYDNYYYAIYDDMNIQLFSMIDCDDGIEGVLVSDVSLINTVNPTRETLDTMEKITFHIINGARKVKGLNPLIWSEQAKQAAYEHSEDMGVNAYFEHIDPNGEDSKQRMDAKGIVGAYYAENLGAGYTNTFDFHYALMHSTGHKMNILTERLTYLGVGIYYDKSSEYKYYLTEDFFEQK